MVMHLAYLTKARQKKGKTKQTARSPSVRLTRVSHGLREAKRNHTVINGREEPISGTAHSQILWLVSLSLSL